MIKIKAKVEYKVPDWGHCNFSSGFYRVSKEKCRFCIETKKGVHACALYNVPLQTEEGYVAVKCPKCVKAGFVHREEIVDEPEVKVNPQEIIKLTLSEYRKTYKQLIAEGYPEAMADTLAQKALLKN